MAYEMASRSAFPLLSGLWTGTLCTMHKMLISRQGTHPLLGGACEKFSFKITLTAVLGEGFFKDFFLFHKVFIKIYTPWVLARAAHEPCRLAGAAGRFPIQVTIPRILCILSLSVGIDVSVMISALLGSACTLAVLFPLPGMQFLLHGVGSRC